MVQPVSPHRVPASSGPGPHPAGEGAALRGGTSASSPPQAGEDALEAASHVYGALRVALANHEAAGTGVGDLETAQALLERVSAAVRVRAAAAVGAQANLDAKAALRLLSV